MTAETFTHNELQPYYVAALEETNAHLEAFPPEALEARVATRKEFGPPRFISDILANPEVAVIAEHKRKSPGEGDIFLDSSSFKTARRYMEGGATALSILTQQKHFGGYIEDISRAAAGATDDDEEGDYTLPILRKDFIENQAQLYQAKAFGASAVLLIAAGLEKSLLERLQAEASDIGLDCLIEVHDERELDHVLEADIGASLIGINNRDLATGEINRQIAYSLAELVPSGVPFIAESGYDVGQPSHIQELRDMGAAGALIGTTLMRRPDPAEALAAWLATEQ